MGNQTPNYASSTFFFWWGHDISRGGNQYGRGHGGECGTIRQHNLWTVLVFSIKAIALQFMNHTRILKGTTQWHQASQKWKVAIVKDLPGALLQIQ